MSGTGNHDQIIQSAARAAVQAVAETAASSTNAMSQAAVINASPELQRNVEQAIAANPLVQNVTNTEPHWWMKRTNWAAIASTFGAVVAIAQPALVYMQGHTTETGTTSVSILGLGFAIWSGYSAWKAGRPGAVPLGTKPANPVPYRG